MKEETGLAHVSVKMPPDLAHLSRIAAATQGRGRSALIRDALTEYLQRHALLPSFQAGKEAPAAEVQHGR